MVSVERFGSERVIRICEYYEETRPFAHEAVSIPVEVTRRLSMPHGKTVWIVARATCIMKLELRQACESLRGTRRVGLRRAY